MQSHLVREISAVVGHGERDLPKTCIRHVQVVGPLLRRPCTCDLLVVLRCVLDNKALQSGMPCQQSRNRLCIHRHKTARLQSLQTAHMQPQRPKGHFCHPLPFLHQVMVSVPVLVSVLVHRVSPLSLLVHGVQRLTAEREIGLGGWRQWQKQGVSHSQHHGLDLCTDSSNRMWIALPTKLEQRMLHEPPATQFRVQLGSQVCGHPVQCFHVLGAHKLFTRFCLHPGGYLLIDPDRKVFAHVAIPQEVPQGPQLLVTLSVCQTNACQLRRQQRDEMAKENHAQHKRRDRHNSLDCVHGMNLH
mmetsp:Transcript_34888/g.78367  ORF Transcript_34888/g.78367 Transcript_34888/m.78367 type:complete len:301 (+) Transcript_34888:767-1669(+)